uniref:Homeobox protein Hox-A10 isoform n=1 Tax=Sus scrofa TaxID=9823 RepID=A0A140E397_PIG|nr:homeobox protein Hox-A10 isoform [Sus scrofa]
MPLRGAWTWLWPRSKGGGVFQPKLSVASTPSSGPPTKVRGRELQRRQARQFQSRKRSQLAHCKERPEEALPLHQAPDAGAGEGVSVQHVPYSRAAPRDQPQRPPHGQTS